MVACISRLSNRNGYSVSSFFPLILRFTISLTILPTPCGMFLAYFWQSWREMGDIYRLSNGEAIAKTLMGEGFSSLFLSLIPCLRSVPKLDVADSTPIARSTFLK